MPVRSTMAALIARERLMIFDPAGASQVFADQDIQNILDESRIDCYNLPLTPQWTFSGNTPLFLDYFAPSQWGNWEDDIVLKQYLTTPVTPSATDDIVGHWTFAQTTLPPVYITGKTYDIYRAAADLLQRLASQWMLRFNATADGQTLHREGAFANIRALIKEYRLKQRVGITTMARSDMVIPAGRGNVGLGPQEIDFMGSG